MRPKISVIIPTKKIIREFLADNIPAFEKQTFKDFEVVILPDKKSSHDDFIEKNPWIRIIPSGVMPPSEKRNLGVSKAYGKLVAFIDDDAYPDIDWLENAVNIFEKKSPEVVCGPGLLPPKANFWERVFDEILKSFFGSSNYTHRFRKESERLVDDYPLVNFLIKKKVFLKVGGFKSNYWPGEDSKFCNELVYQYGDHIFYSPDVVVYHHRRQNIKAYLKQHGSYGFHRGLFFAQGDINSKKIFYLIPTFFVVYLFSLVLMLFLPSKILLGSLFFLPLFLYLLGCLQFFIKSFLSTKNIQIALTSTLVLSLTHIAYGSMFVNGYLNGTFKRNSSLAKT